MPELPAGTVTFLFTDIEGSTKLLEELGDRYPEALAEHRRVLREAFERHSGVEVDTQGDAFFVAFQRASEALATADEAQRALELPVRMGIHTGEPTLTPEGYVGIDVHRAARICSAAHGGQVVLSETTRKLLDGVGLHDLGEHRLKDLGQPVRLYQLGEHDFPPLRSLNQTNLPAQPSPLVGRERELQELLRLVPDSRLVTLTGPGGSGKTRLALQTAAELVERFEGGVFWVPLAAVSDSELVEPTIAQTVGAQNGLATHVADKQMLLLLDNFEQVVDAAPNLSDLLERCPNLHLLSTSRALLRIAGERDYPVEPLPDADAVELFRERAAVAEPIDAVREICRRLDGLPLAIELAAARTRLLPPEQLLQRLEHALPLLTAGRRDAPERQRTLRATIEWSYDLLSKEERRLFSRLAVFAGSFTVEAAEEVCDADLDTLESLVEHSLMRRWASGRLGMLETIREYAAERLEQSDEAEEIRRRHAEFFLALAQSAGPHLEGAEQAEWLQRIEAERDNVRATLEWALGADAGLALQIAADLGRFWWVRGPAEGLAWLERGLEQADVAPAVRAGALDAAGGTAWFVGDHERALRLFEEGLATFRELGDRAGAARMLTRLGPPLTVVGRYEEADRVVREAAAIHRELGNSIELAMSLHILGAIAAERGDWQSAAPLMEESAALARETGDTWQLAYGLSNLAEVAIRSGNLEVADRHGREALTFANEIGDDVLTIFALALRSITVARRGDLERAGALWGAAEQLDEELGESMWRRERVAHEQLLGERGAAFERGVEAGLKLSLEEGVRLALEP